MMQYIASLIDLTLLDALASHDAIQTLATKGMRYDVAALCVYPQHLNLIPASCTINRATVVNFPTGIESHDQVLKSIEHIATHQEATEIDYVFPYQTYLAGDHKTALTCSAQVYQLCQQQNLLLKVILETGALRTTDMIYQMSLDVINSGCDFIKTSTGKMTVGATIPAAIAMLTAILDSKISCGIKLSGGIRSIQQAQAYIKLVEKMMDKNVDKRWFRIGASGLLDELAHHILI